MSLNHIITAHSATIRVSDIDLIPDLFSGFGPTRLNGVSFTAYQQGNLATVYEPLSGISAGASLASAAAYIPNSHYIDYTFQFDISAALFANNVRSAMFTTTQSRYQMLFSPTIIKTSRDRMRFSVRHSWSRFVP